MAILTLRRVLATFLIREIPDAKWQIYNDKFVAMNCSSELRATISVERHSESERIYFILKFKYLYLKARPIKITEDAFRYWHFYLAMCKRIFIRKNYNAYSFRVKTERMTTWKCKRYENLQEINMPIQKFLCWGKCVASDFIRRKGKSYVTLCDLVNRPLQWRSTIVRAKSEISLRLFLCSRILRIEADSLERALPEFVSEKIDTVTDRRLRSRCLLRFHSGFMNNLSRR